MGITAFKFFPQTQSLECFPFNFYLLPHDQDKHFQVSVGSFRFLAEHRFDFNRLFYDGVGYMNKEEHQSYRKKNRLNPSTIDIEYYDSPDCVKYCEDMCQVIEK